MSDTRISQQASAMAAVVGVLEDVMGELDALKKEDPGFQLPVATAVQRADKALAGAWDQCSRALQFLRVADGLENADA